jgi:hypothetical protein
MDALRASGATSPQFIAAIGFFLMVHQGKSSPGIWQKQNSDGAPRARVQNTNKTDATPDFKQLLGDPSRVYDIPRRHLPEAMLHVGALLASLAAAAATANDGAGAHAAAHEGDRLLTLDEAAAQANVTVNWLRRHRHLPFFVTLSRKNIRVSERRLQKYLQSRSGR